MIEPEYDIGVPLLFITDVHGECEYQLWNAKSGGNWYWQWRMLVLHDVHFFDLGYGKVYVGPGVQNGDCYESEWRFVTAGEALDDVLDFVQYHIISLGRISNNVS